MPELTYRSLPSKTSWCGMRDRDLPYCESDKAETRVRHLLTHTFGLPYLDPLLERFHAYRRTVPLQGSTIFKRFDHPPIAGPGTDLHYGSLFDWLGLLVERLTGQSLQTVHLDEHQYEPLSIAYQ